MYRTNCSAGWGNLESGGSFPDKLNFVKVQGVPCVGGNSDYEESRISESMFCANQLGRDACQGDSGGMEGLGA